MNKSDHNWDGRADQQSNDQLRYERHQSGPVIIYYKTQRMGAAKPLDQIANGLLRRKDN